MCIIKMNHPRVTKDLHITPGIVEDYRRFERWHYRYKGSLGPYTAIYCMRQRPDYPGTNANRLVGVIVYATPTAGCQGRDIATGGFFKGLSRYDRLAMLNKYVRRISRLIIEPRYRGCGLAGELVRRTMPLLNVPYIEAMAAMGHFNPFLEKAGMTPYKQPKPIRNTLLIEALSIVGIELNTISDCDELKNRIASLNRADKSFIEGYLRTFACRINRCFDIIDPCEHIEQIWKKLSITPVYYIWKNTEYSR